jgi:hypothetical protein
MYQESFFIERVHGAFSRRWSSSGSGPVVEWWAGDERACWGLCGGVVFSSTVGFVLRVLHREIGYLISFKGMSMVGVWLWL